MTDASECPQCEGTGLIKVESRDGRDTYKRCECYFNAQRDSLNFGVPKRFADKTFDNFSAGRYRENRVAYNTLTRALRSAQQFAEGYPVVDRKGLLLHGGAIGKMTHLAVGMLKVLMTKGLSCLFCGYPELLRNLQDQRFAESGAEDRGRSLDLQLRTVDVLLLDSLGEHRRTPWVVDAVNELIKYRYDHDKGLIVTTTLPLAGVPRRGPAEVLEQRTYNPMRDTLADRIGSECAARLLEHCAAVSMAEPEPALAVGRTGADYPARSGSRPNRP